MNYSWIHNLTASGWFQAVAWAVGFPLVTVVVVLGGMALLQRYARTVAGVPEALSPFSIRWRNEHRRLIQGIALGFYFLSILHTRVTDLVFVACLSALALYLGGWAGWCVLSGRAPDVPSRVYCAGILVAAFFVLGVAFAYHKLTHWQYHAPQRTEPAITLAVPLPHGIGR